MANLDDEYDATIEVVVKSYRRLKELNPDHDLLKLLEDFHQSTFNISEEFSRRYPYKWWEFTEGTARDIRRWERYQSDLEDSIKEEERKVPA